MDSEKKIKVLVVDDEKVVRDFLIQLLSLWSVEVKAVEDGLRAIELARQEKFDIIFLDIRMPRINGLQAFSEIKKLNPDFTNCVFMTGYAIEADLLEITKQNGTVILKKPFEDVKQIEGILNNVLQQTLKPQTKKSRQERRAFVRLDIALEVNYKVKERGELVTNSLSKNVSFGGIRLFIPEELKPPTILELEIKFPEDGKILNATAEVVWARESKEKIGYFDTGLKFLDIEHMELATLLVHSNKSR